MMNRTIFALAIAVSVFAAGCGSEPVDQRPPNSAPIPVDNNPHKIPTTKAEKIEAINKAPISEEQKKAAIAKVNSEPGD